MTVSNIFAWGGLLVVVACTVLVGAKVREKRRLKRRAKFLHKFDDTRATHTETRDEREARRVYNERTKTDRNREEQARGVFRDHEGNLPPENKRDGG